MAEIPPYRYAGRPLSANTFRFVAHELFANHTARKATIVSRVCEHHNSHGGGPETEEGLKDRATLALRKSVHMGYAFRENGTYTFVADPPIAEPTPAEPLPAEPVVPAQQAIKRRIKATDSLREGLAYMQGFKCGAVTNKLTWGCRNEFGFATIHRLPLRYAAVDHIVPLRHRGPDAHSNLQLLCRSCHAFKSANESGEMRRRGVSFLRQIEEEDTKRLQDELANLGEGDEDGEEEDVQEDEDDDSDDDDDAQSDEEVGAIIAGVANIGR